MNIVVTSGIAGKGHNRSPFELSSEAIEALFETGEGFLDGKPITSEAEEKAVDKLLDAFRDAAKTAEAHRVAEKKPWDEGAAAVQALWKPILAKAELGVDTCKKVLAPYRKAIADAKLAAAIAARKEAEDKRLAAEAAFRASQVDNLAERATAEALLDEAKKAEKLASKADKAATTGLGLRTSYQAEITDMSAFARYCWTNHKAEVDEFFETLAKQLVARKVMTMPGVTVHEIRGAI